MPTYPNVPDVPGVPAVLRDAATSAASAITILTADLVTSSASAVSQQQWGLYLNGESVVTADTVVSFEYREDWHIATAQQEEGAFLSYDKVQAPFDVRLRFSQGGSLSDRQALLRSVMDIIGSTDLYDAVMPEQTYSNVNPTHYDFKRTATAGLGLMTIDLYCELVMPQQASLTSASGTSASINQPQSASASPQVSGGTVAGSPNATVAADFAAGGWQ